MVSQMRTFHMPRLIWLSYEPGHSNSYTIACAPSEYLDEPAHPRSLIRVIVDRMRIFVCCTVLCGDSDCVDAQADLSLL